MRKNTIALLLALAITLGAATIALAVDTETDGSIKFKAGDVIILPPHDPYDPGTCCPCYGEEPDDCDCPCHIYDKYADPEDGEDFRDFDMGGDLYFGEWTIGAHGKFDSRDNGVPDRKFTGVLLINQTAAPATIQVSITKFFYDKTVTELEGAELTLNAHKLAAGAGYNAAAIKASNSLLSSVALEDPLTDYHIITIPAGSRVKASWYGDLDVRPGTAKYAGTAQAALTWTVATGP